ncbi:hypothetical protein ACFOLA_08680 [Salinicoccus hispanicus]|uniref:Uncharacterized protein n=1 Tax=Salinicoccus hispanicus TaxID=157225 RepID=A0A6N8U219_9STAP|nr:hypothetical protein [Salinicoccus hispanicus]MXQ51832.1 hypothetical protein [Salinicoccus hispanicus]
MLIGKQEKYIEQLGASTVTADELPGFIRKAAGVMQKFSTVRNEEAIRQSIESRHLIHHPMWIIKNTVVATRRPFKPKRIPNMIFIDAVSGYRGLLSTVPAISEVVVEKNSIIHPVINESDVGRYMKDVQARQIDRSYVLKKPQHEPSEPRLVHLPLWKVVMTGEKGREVYYINANTGESEAFMSRRWSSGEDLINQINKEDSVWKP